MLKLKALILKEVKAYFHTALGYILASLFGISANFLFLKDLFLRDDATMRPFFETSIWLFVLFIPAASMRIFSEEKNSNTIEILFTLPVSEAKVVISKLISIAFFSFVCIAMTFPIPVALFFLADIQILPILIAYIGLFLFGIFFASISMFFSALTKSYVTAFILSTLSIFVWIIAGSDFFSDTIPKSAYDIIISFSPMHHFEQFVKGVIDIRSLFFCFSGIMLFVFLTVIECKKRK